MRIALAGLLIAALPITGIAARMPITNVRPLLMAAINSLDGSAHGVMVGEVAEVMLKRMGSANPIEVDVRTLHDLPQTGCKRLEVTTRQKAVIEPGKKLPEDKSLIYKVSFCGNGKFPEKGKEE